MEISNGQYISGLKEIILAQHEEVTQLLDKVDELLKELDYAREQLAELDKQVYNK